MASSEKLQFLYASIADIQSTIRAIDSKVNYLLVVLFLPLTKLGAIFGKFAQLFAHHSATVRWFAFTSSILFTVCWLLSTMCALLTLLAIGDSKERISGERPDSTFHPSSLFDIGFLNALSLNARHAIKRDFKEHYDSIPEDKESIAEQLAVEQVKLMYIVALKGCRSRYAYGIATAWAIIGGAIWLLNLYCFHHI